MTNRDFNSQVEDILTGSFDLHVHSRPDPEGRLRLDAMDTGRHAHEAEMAGFVLKSHYYPTAPLALALNRVYPGLSVAGSVVLNNEVGGLNPDAVQVAADLGARVVWMPTFSADFYMAGRGAGPGIRVTDEGGGVLPQVHEILDIVHRSDMVLASGHLSPAETVTLFGTAKDRGIRRTLATHPQGIATADEMGQMVSMGAYVEFTLFSTIPPGNKTTVEEIANSVRTLGAEHCVMTSDFGQWMHPPPAEGMRMAIAALLQAGLTADEVSSLVKDNPLQLVEPG